MKRVTGIGGVFFKANDATVLQAWYKRHLGIDVQTWGGASFDWTDFDGNPTGGTTAWLIVPQDSKQFAPGIAPFMVNYRVEDLQSLVAVLKAEGCNILDEIIDTEFGKFAHILDSEGNKVELWQATHRSMKYVRDLSCHPQPYDFWNHGITPFDPDLP